MAYGTVSLEHKRNNLHEVRVVVFAARHACTGVGIASAGSRIVAVTDI